MGRKWENKREDERTPMWFVAMLDLLRGGGGAVLTALLVLAAGAFLISAGIIGDNRMSSAVIAACLIGSLAGGLITVQRRQSMTLIYGICVGTVLFLFLQSAGFLLYGGETERQGVVPILCACLCGGGLSGVLGSKPKKKRRR